MSSNEQMLQVVRLEAKLEAAEAEVARLRAGESDEPNTPEAVPSPGQWIRLWNENTPAKRLEWAERIIADGDAAYRCRIYHGELQERAEAAEAKVEQWRREANYFRAAATALGLPSSSEPVTAGPPPECLNHAHIPWNNWCAPAGEVTPPAEQRTCNCDDIPLPMPCWHARPATGDAP